MKRKPIKKSDILKYIVSHFQRTTGKLDRTGEGKVFLAIETDHGKADQIGQHILRTFPQVSTYLACHIFKRASLKIFFKR